jgi:hypothetical protein
MHQLPSARPALALLGLAAALWLPGSPRAARQEPSPESPRGAIAIQQEQLSERLRGLWTLTRYEPAVRSSARSAVVASLLVEQRVLAFFSHVDRLDATLFDQKLEFQAGLHHWRISDELRLQTSSMISHTNMNQGLQFEPPGTVREYALEFDLDGPGMSLRRPDGTTLYFERNETIVFPENSIKRIEAYKAGGVPPNAVR